MSSMMRRTTSTHGEDKTMTLIGNKNKRVLYFGKRNRIAVTFTRRDGLWMAHRALMSRGHRNIRVARQMVASRLAQQSQREAEATR